MRIELKEYVLSELKYFPNNSAFKEAYKDSPNIRRIRFKIPKDAYITQIFLFHIFGRYNSFPEYNCANGDEIETIVEISDKEEVFLDYPSNQEHIDALKRELSTLENRMNQIKWILKKL